MIEDNLVYDEEEKCWIASYPYLFPRETLRGTREIALKSMLATERSLLRNGNGQVYNQQKRDMIECGVARRIPAEELAAYHGPVNYLPHLAAFNPKSQSTPVRICFDASRSQGGAPSLNQILA